MTPEQEHPEVFEEYWRQARTRTADEREALPDTVYVARAYANSPEVATKPKQPDVPVSLQKDATFMLPMETVNALDEHFGRQPYIINDIVQDWLQVQKALRG